MEDCLLVEKHASPRHDVQMTPSSTFFSFFLSFCRPATTAFVHTEWPRCRLEAHTIQDFCASDDLVSDFFESFLRRHNRPCSLVCLCWFSIVRGLFTNTKKVKCDTGTLVVLLCTHMCVRGFGAGFEVQWDMGGAGWSSGGCAKTTSQVVVDCRPGRFSRWWSPTGSCRMRNGCVGWRQSPRLSGRHQRADGDVHLWEPSVLHGKGSAPHLALSFSPFSQVTIHAKLCDERRSAVTATFCIGGRMSCQRRVDDRARRAAPNVCRF